MSESSLRHLFTLDCLLTTTTSGVLEVEPIHTDTTSAARRAIAVIRNSNHDLLMHLRDDVVGNAWPGHWSALGGGCDPGEMPADAIVRELAKKPAPS
jgi:ADP-ribose pyrophosphatase YjhB (NUDIX family)